MKFNDIILICMATLWLHIADDFYLQGMLANLKQKSWWEEHARDYMYRNDYKAALIIHGISWSIMVHLPVMIYLYLNNGPLYVTLFSIGVHAYLHANVDNDKANHKIINLIEDQLQHLFQIAIILLVNLVFA